MQNGFQNFRGAFAVLISAAALVGFTACGGDKTASAPEAAGKSPDAKAPVERTLTLAAYTTPREVYGKAIIPAFQKMWKDKTGENVTFQESYLGSGAQSRAVEGGFEADVVALSLEPDVTRLVKAGLVAPTWNKGPGGGMVSRSVVVLGVREGNPLGIKDWTDIAKSGVEVLTPNVRTSGGAMWNVAAIYGAALRGKVAGVAAGDVAAATKFLGQVMANVRIMDKGARESLLTFEKGVGEVIITYENEILLGQKTGKKYAYVVPASTILIENPAAVVDAYASKHGNLDLAAAFVEFLRTKEVQEMFVKDGGLRPVLDDAAPAVTAALPKVEDLFRIGDLGHWAKVVPEIFGQGGIYDKAMEGARKP